MQRRFKELLKAIDLEKDSEELKEGTEGLLPVRSVQDIIKSLEVVEAFRESGNKPEWMIMDC